MFQTQSVSHKFQGYVFKQMSLGDLLTALSNINDGTPVEFDNYEMPGVFMSYRGYYNEAGLSEGDAETTCGDLKSQLSLFIGSTQVGYKGGEYRMTNDTPLWRADYGRTGYPIVGTVMRDEKLVLLVDVQEE